MPFQKDATASGSASSSAGRHHPRASRRSVALSGVRLPALAALPLQSWFGSAVVLRPWFDWVAVRAVAQLYLPLSRAWAAALSAQGSCERFWEDCSLRPVGHGRLETMLAEADRRRLEYEAAAAIWEDTFFGISRARAAELATRELARATAAQNLMAIRRIFLPIHLRRRLPAVAWDLPTLAEVEARHGLRLAGAAAAFPAPPSVAIELSHPIPGAGGTERWLRFHTPSKAVNDTAWARAYIPAGVADPPTFIFLHGIFMETEMMREVADPVNAMVRAGVRVIRPEGPWHGRRRLSGFYGGEPVAARGPLGLIDIFEAWVSEVAVLIGWARATSRGPIAIGGISLGALVSQLVAVVAGHWPASLQPDALFLLGTCAEMRGVALEGSLSRELSLPRRLNARGWTEEQLMRWHPLMDPQGEPVVPPERIVMLLGRADDLTPIEGGLALARAWKVPEENLFLPWRGHFSAGLGLYRDTSPLRRLLMVLNEAGGGAAA